ncbi:phage holin family protein [Enterococcus faecalis]|nr:phage holin family protein [Enterococcus faecalis]EGO8309156.1 phage holin family protein [Enterococcus faecalis]
MVIIDNQALIAEFKNLISNGFIQVFVWIVLGDIATGICKGIYREEGNSTKGLPGLIKHLLVVCLVIVTYPYLKIMGFSSIADGFVLFYIAVYGLSITENLGQLGVPLPSWVKNHLSKLKDENDKGGEPKDGTSD